MKRIVLTSLLSILFVASIVPVYASITVESIINDAFHVSFDFSNINSTIYNDIVAQGVFNSTSIPRTIMRNLEKQNLKKVSWSQASTNIFRANGTIHVEFDLWGEDILSYTLKKGELARTCTVKTNWIRFDIKLTNTFTLNLTTYFTTPISRWQRINHTINGNIHPSFYYNSTAGTPPFYALCYFILPTAATNIKTAGDTLTFDMPLLLEDKLIDSPILILGALVIANIVVIIYRKVRK